MSYQLQLSSRPPRSMGLFSCSVNCKLDHIVVSIHWRDRHLLLSPLIVFVFSSQSFCEPSLVWRKRLPQVSTPEPSSGYNPARDKVSVWRRPRKPIGVDEWEMSMQQDVWWKKKKKKKKKQLASRQRAKASVKSSPPALFVHFRLLKKNSTNWE